MADFTPGLIDPGFNPALHTGQRQNARAVIHRFCTERELIAFQSQDNRCKEGVHGSESLPRQKRSAKTGEPLLPQLVNAIEVFLQRIVDTVQGNGYATVHTALVAQGEKAGMHFRSGTASPGSGLLVLGPNRRVGFVQVFSDGEGLPYRSVTIYQARHQTGWGKFAEFVPAATLVKGY